jgi:steroid delta-isomerase-like uncharacterized protein
MSAEENKANDRRFFEAWNQGNQAIVDELCAPNYVLHDPDTTVRGVEEFKQYIASNRTAFPDGHFTIEDQIAEGNMLATRWTFRGTHQGELRGVPPTGKQVTVTGIGIYRIEGGKFEESWVNFDVLGLLQQLGVIPPMG